jgi:hypothetical protein
MDLSAYISENSTNGAFIRINVEHPLDIYIGKDEFGHVTLEFKGVFKIRRVPSLKSFAVRHVENKNATQLFIILLNNEMIGIFSSFIEDIISSTKDVNDNQKGYDIIVDRIFSWCKMFQLNREELTEAQVKGLIGELLFLKTLLHDYNEFDAINSWSGPDKTKKDFAIDKYWWEVKTINVGKPYVQISSLEQLDSDKEGKLVVFEVEKMSDTFDGLNLYKLSSEIYHSFENAETKDIFLSKLSDFGYDFSEKYKCYVYELRKVQYYIVNSDFPKLVRSSIHPAISDAKYDLLLSELSTFRIQNHDN